MMMMVADGDGRHVAFWVSNVDRQTFKRKLSADSLGTSAKTSAGGSFDGEAWWL